MSMSEVYRLELQSPGPGCLSQEARTADNRILRSTHVAPWFKSSAQILLKRENLGQSVNKILFAHLRTWVNGSITALNTPSEDQTEDQLM